MQEREKRIRPIVIGADHYNTLGLLRSLGESGFKPELILIGENISEYDSFVAASKYVEGCRIVDTPAFAVELLKNESTDEDLLTILFPAGDEIAEAIDAQLDNLPNGFVAHNVERKAGKLSEVSDKEKMRRKAAEYGFETPSTWLVSNGESIPADVEFPCMIKGLHSSTFGKDDTVYHNREELIQGVSNVMDRTDVVQIQKFLKKEREIIFLGWSIEGDVSIPCVMEKIREYPEKFGCTGLGYFHADLSRWFSISRLMEMIASYQYTGLFSVEFLITKGKAIFLEINFRNDGNGYFPGNGGVNLVENYIAGLSGTKKAASTDRINHPFYMLRELVDFKYMLHTGYPIWKWISDVWRAEVYQIWNGKDMKPFRRLIANKLLHRLHIK